MALSDEDAKKYREEFRWRATAPTIADDLACLVRDNRRDISLFGRAFDSLYPNGCPYITEGPQRDDL